MNHECIDLSVLFNPSIINSPYRHEIESSVRTRVPHFTSSELESRMEVVPPIHLVVDGFESVPEGVTVSCVLLLMD